MIADLCQWSTAELTSAWWQVLIPSSLKVTLLFLAAGAGALVLRRRAAAASHLLWSVALGGALVLPFLSIGLPSWRALPTLDGLELTRAGFGGARPPAIEAYAVPPAGPRAPASGPSAAPVPAAPTAATPPQEIAGSPRSTWALAVWAAGGLVILACVAAGAASLRRLRRDAQPIHDGPLAALLTELRGELGLGRRIDLLLSPRRAMPMTWGVLRPRILLPAAAAAWPLERSRAVLLHELAHVRRRDCLWELMAQASCAIYWFHPLVWIALRRLAAARERACDDLALRHGCEAADYAGHLLEVASSLSSRSPFDAAAIAMAKRSSLEGRMLAILDRRRDRRGLSRASKLLALAALCGLIPPLAMVAAQEGPTQQVRRTTRAPAQRGQGLGSVSVPLPGGATLELVALSRSPAAASSWWRLDGAPLGAELTLLKPLDPEAEARGRSPLWLAISVENASEPVAVRCEWASSSSPAWTPALVAENDGAFSSPSEASLAHLWLASIAAPPADETLRLRMGVAAGAWTTFATADAGGSRTVAPGSGPGAVFQAAEAETNQVVVRLLDTLGDADDRRVVALDRQGGTRAPAWSKVDQIPGARLTTLAFQDIDVAGLSEVRLETRPFGWVVELASVSLEAGKRTRVETVAAASGPPASGLSSVRIVIAPEGLSLDGKPVTLEELRGRLEAVPERSRTVIEVAAATPDLAFARYNDLLQALLRLQVELGFHSTSQVGVQPPAAGGEGKGQARAAWTFGPVVDRVIAGDRDEWMLDLDSGRTHGAVVIGGESAVPEEMDLSFVHTPGAKGLRASSVAAVELCFRPGSAADWDIDPTDILPRLADGEPAPAGFRTAPLAGPKDKLPATFLFRTREGAEGVLQILGFTDEPGGVSLRYKTVVEAAGPGEPGALRLEPRDPSFQGVKVDIAAGEIRVIEFLRFLADFHGLPVRVDSSIPEQSIHLGTAVKDAAGDLVRSLLEAKGIRVGRTRLPNGQDVLDVTVER